MQHSLTLFADKVQIFPSTVEKLQTPRSWINKWTISKKEADTGIRRENLFKLLLSRPAFSLPGSWLEFWCSKCRWWSQTPLITSKNEFPGQKKYCYRQCKYFTAALTRQISDEIYKNLSDEERRDRPWIWIYCSCSFISRNWTSTLQLLQLLSFWSFEKKKSSEHYSLEKSQGWSPML